MNKKYSLTMLCKRGDKAIAKKVSQPITGKNIDTSERDAAFIFPFI